MPPETPANVIEVYRDAFAKVSIDTEFVDEGGHLSEGFVIMNHVDVRSFVQTLAETPPPAIKYMNTMMKEQGLPVK